MKKAIYLGLITLSAVVLTACGGEEKTTKSSVESSAASSTTEKSEATQTSNSSTEQTTTYPTDAYKQAPFDASFNPGNGYKIKSITKATGSMENKPIILIEMTFTNNGNNPSSPYMAFVTDWDVQQTDGTVTKTLNGANGRMGNVENQEAVEMGDTNVNPGATVDAVIGYTLEFENEDVGFITRSTANTSNPQGFAWANK
ncbi:DUF5067 domain-containing protein [Streptococcus pluranimalium]